MRRRGAPRRGRTRAAPRRYVDGATNRFSTAMSAMIFLQLFLTIMLYAETYIARRGVF